MDKFLGYFLCFTAIVCWFNSIFYAFENEQWLLVLVNVIALPIGIIHGAYLFLT